MKNYFQVVIFIVLLSFFAFYSCEESPVVINNDDIVLSMKTYPFNIDSVRNITWRLSMAKSSDELLDIYAYKPCALVFNDTMFYGYDGCNHFYGKYRIHNDTMTLFDGGTHQLACIDKPQIDFCMQFTKPLRIRLTASELLFQRSDAVFMYSSIYKIDISNYPFVNKTWKMKNSDDASFHFLDSLHLTPKLYIGSNREYYLRWNFDSNNSQLPYSENTGVFGVGVRNSLSLFSAKRIYKNIYLPGEFSDTQFIDRILKTEKFSYTDSTFRLRSLTETRIIMSLS